ncbi:hypothetical protein OAO01_06430 [Oligoflexia bacterium]|nr:hypothetical protein [Oligoflexia bacterium]
MIRKCSASGRDFSITDEDLAFYKQLQVDAPTLCPDERQRRRLAFRNERTLYYRKCSATGKRMLSIYSPDKPFPVYENDYWWSDKWDAGDYGRAFDFTKPFFEQFYALQSVVPHCSLAVIKPSIENSEYCNQVGFIKNCYLIFDSRRSENCMYGKTIERCYDCVDCLKVFDCEACYEVVASQQCQYCTDLLACNNCNDCHFSRNLLGCSYCFGCTNLRNKQYYFYNERLSKAAWLTAVQEALGQTTRDDLRCQFRAFERTQYVKWMQEHNTEDCSGDYLVDCKDCHHCFDSEYLEQCKYCYDLKKDDAVSYNNYDVCHFGGNVESCYECCSIGNTTSRLRFCENVWSCNDVTYSRVCTQSHDLFGCLCLRNAEYCILNKAYRKAEYFEVRDKIIEHMRQTGEWGQFFPIQYSPYGYNETLAQEYFPITEASAQKQGWKWRSDSEENVARPAKLYDPPRDIAQVNDDIIDQVLICAATGKPYRITRSELTFYRKRGLPLPLLCFEARHAYRMSLRNPRRLYPQQCDRTGQEILTTYPPDAGARVCSRVAYNEVVD